MSNQNIAGNIEKEEDKEDGCSDDEHTGKYKPVPYFPEKFSFQQYEYSTNKGDNQCPQADFKKTPGEK